MISHLNAVPESLLEEARSLGDPDAAEQLLVEHTSAECWEFLTLFVHEVVFGEEKAATWMRGQVVVPDFSLDEQLGLDRPALLAPLGGWFQRRIPPSLTDWREGVLWIGAPALALPDADYRYKMPDRAVGLGQADTERVSNQVVALRRWIATRLALVVRPHLQVASIGHWIRTHHEIPPFAEWSEDARCAGEALLRECKELGVSDQAVPGMRGPDRWFGNQE